MADPFCSHLEGRAGCASHGFFLSRDCSMVVCHDRWCNLRTSFQSGNLSGEGRSEIWRRTIRDSERDYYRRFSRPFYRSVRGEKDLNLVRHK
jgi:hypothetical protein